eukprot:scaffold223186_cov20-Prasinocladus_malaysianus.AAC.1
MESCFRQFSLQRTKPEPGGQAMGCRKSMEDRHTVISCLRPITQGGEAVVDGCIMWCCTQAMYTNMHACHGHTNGLYA